MIIGVIDPGHSRGTSGKSNPPYYEYKSNREVAVKLKKLLESTGKFKIYFPFDLNISYDTPLADRAAAAVRLGADFFVSIHSNASVHKSARGTETYIHDDTQASVPFANEIQKHLVNSLGTRNRGVKRANFGVLRGTYKYMLSCLTEGEFFSNTAARDWMLTADYSNKYAEGVANGLCSFYNVAAPGKVNNQEPPKVEPADDEGALLIEVVAKELWTYASADWSDKELVVKKDEVFTVKKGPFSIDGGRMYQLKSGLYITANEKYVNPIGTVKKVEDKPQPKLIRIDVGELWTYNSKNWNDKAVVVTKDEVFTLASGKIKVDGYYMYKLKSGLYITANEKYISIV
jgi:N-acetylmuramoyl-L-alanine amidase